MQHLIRLSFIQAKCGQSKSAVEYAPTDDSDHAIEQSYPSLSSTLTGYIHM